MKSYSDFRYTLYYVRKTAMEGLMWKYITGDMKIRIRNQLSLSKSLQENGSQW